MCRDDLPAGPVGAKTFIFSVNCTFGDTGTQEPASKMPLYRPEQLDEPGACLGCLERVFFFGTVREPDIFVDMSAQYETKMAAWMAHRSQFPKGEESLEWMKELDKKPGEVIDTTCAERFKSIQVW